MNSGDYTNIGDVIEIPGLRGKWKRIENRYDLEKSRCANCGGFGIPWRGWFKCDDCASVALIETGETFVQQLKEHLESNSDKSETHND